MRPLLTMNGMAYHEAAILLAYPAEAVNLDLALGGLLVFNVSTKLSGRRLNNVGVNSNSA